MTISSRCNRASPTPDGDSDLWGRWSGLSGCGNEPPFLLSIRRRGVSRWWGSPAPSRRSLFLSSVVRSVSDGAVLLLDVVRLGSSQVHERPTRLCPRLELG
ncbi:hypothetical protein CRG98_041467 [Punica granatum]|uniref:Uncharacterized protein n=1 Tax=Punica granatum TaxID=22663 RepID=A0A2I0I2B6_PUNGR|nr:hypothetical protein CRG98_041467 [Punica granatum]